MKLRCRDRVLALDRTLVMGVLNVTPDSFSDGGLYLEADAAIERGLQMQEQGAAILDIGGESTRPDAEPVTAEEEIRRVIPVVEALASRAEAVISVDTRKPEVARLAVEAGAHIINDTAGEEADPTMGDLAAQLETAIVLMHSRGTPQTMRSLARYEDVVHEVGLFLHDRAREIQDAGVPRDAIVLDPGFGFAKTPEHNLELLRRLDEIVSLGYPVLAGTSRKSFIGAVLDLPEDQRVEGTAATIAWAIARGAAIVRVHDVREMALVAKMSDAIKSAAGGRA